VTTVLRPEHALELARQRAATREELLAEIRTTLRRWADEGITLGHFENGAFFTQLAHEVNTLKIELGDRRQTDRRFRKKIKPELRARCFRRDGWVCQDCGWVGPTNEADRVAAASKGHRSLTLDHVIPETEGGATTFSNLVTKCTVCNHRKGAALPEAAP
jgi:5-methylcytosine-specific restriction endonuclease McrA